MALQGLRFFAAAHELVDASHRVYLDFVAHGMGPVSHEAPRLTGYEPWAYEGYDATRPLEADMVLSIETTMAHPKRGFIKLEDTVAVTEEGCAAWASESGRGWNRAGQRFKANGWSPWRIVRELAAAKANSAHLVKQVLFRRPANLKKIYPHLRMPNALGLLFLHEHRYCYPIIQSPGAMGRAISVRLVEHGARVLTSLDGRSAATVERARAAGMEDVPPETITTAELILSIEPPGEAVAQAKG